MCAVATPALTERATRRGLPAQEGLRHLDEGTHRDPERALTTWIRPAHSSGIPEMKDRSFGVELHSAARLPAAVAGSHQAGNRDRDREKSRRVERRQQHPRRRRDQRRPIGRGRPQERDPQTQVRRGTHREEHEVVEGALVEVGS